MGLTVKHAFVSSKPEQSDPTIVGANEWNATHSVIDSSGQNWNVDYIFTPIGSLGNLTGGVAATITLPNVPLGVNGTDSNHYLYISGGIGTAEAVLITGGTAVSGGSNQTLIFTPANNHSGAWTLSTATAGIQEMYNYASNKGTQQTYGRISPGTFNVYQVATFTGVGFNLQGCGITVSILMQQNNALGVLKWNQSANGDGQVGDLAIIYASQGTGGNALEFDNCIYGAVHHTKIANAYNATAFVNCFNIHVHNNTWAFITSRCLQQSSNPLLASTEIFMLDNDMTLNSPTSGVGIELDTQFVGGHIIGTFIQNGQYGIYCAASNAYALNEFIISDFTIDSYSQYGIFLQLQNAGASSSRVEIRNGKLAGGDSTHTSIGIYAAAASNGSINPLIISDVQIIYWTGAGIALSYTQHVTISDCDIRCADPTGAGSGIALSAGTNNTTINNVLVCDLNGTCTTNLPANGIILDASVHSNFYAANCRCFATTPFSNSSTDLTTVEFAETNRPINPATVASAAAFPLPAFPDIIVSGTTGITSITGFNIRSAGRRGRIMFNNAAPGNVTAGATIYTSLTPVQFTWYSWYCDGTKIGIH